MKSYSSIPVGVKQFHRTVNRTLKEASLFPSHSRILVACSGGPDSMVLWSCLSFLNDHRKAHWHIAVATMNHEIRKAGSDELEFVRRIAQERGTEFWGTARNIPLLSEERKESLETTGREERYRWLATLAREEGYAYIVTGHHKDDQAESILAHIIRGSGLTGLTGMSPVAEVFGIPLIRPLLRVSKNDILDYAKALSIPFCLDESNETGDYGRNKIRHTLMPVLRELNPRIEDALNRLGDNAREDMSYIDEEALRTAHAMVHIESGRCRISRRNLRSLHSALQSRIWQHMIDQVSQDRIVLSKAHQKQLADIVRTGESKKFNINRIIICARYDTIEVYWQC